MSYPCPLSHLLPRWLTIQYHLDQEPRSVSFTSRAINLKQHFSRTFSFCFTLPHFSFCFIIHHFFPSCLSIFLIPLCPHHSTFIHSYCCVSFWCIEGIGLGKLIILTSTFCNVHIFHRLQGFIKLKNSS